MGKLNIQPGNNIRIKIPLELFEETLNFYRDILLLETEEITTNPLLGTKSVIINFGSINLCLDGVATQKDSKIHFEISANQVQNAIDYFKVNEINFVNPEEENLENKTWIKDPAGNIFLLSSENE